uniref:CULLIN_2 domain-containing protein n=2 Tax=Mesocestoides corti TaxID=53468 RepID=A0A5K3FK58_MESCO
MVSRPDKLAELWKTLKPLFDKMLNMEDLSKAEHASICNCVYGYCTSVDTTYNTGASSKVIGFDLYKKLRSFFKQHVQSLRAKGETKTGSDLLTFFEKNWTNFVVAAKYIDHRCNYLNRNWVKTKIDEGQKDVVIVYSLALMIWKDELFKPCSHALMAAVLNEIERERKGESIAATRLCTIISSLVDLCITSEHHTQPSSVSQLPHPTLQATQTHSVRQFLAPPVPTHISCDPPPAADWRQGLPIYRDYFEQPFLRETMHFYELESNEFLKSNSVTEYLKRVEMRLEEERTRARTYLHASTLNELIKTCEESLIGNHIEALASEFQTLLAETRIEDLARMYKALIRFEDGEARLVQMMELHVDEVGSEALKEVCQSAIANPRLFVDTIVGVQRKNKELLQSAFSMNASFARALDKGCERFINRNAITEIAGSSRKTPELLAKYADLLLKKGTKEAQPDDLEETLNCVMEVFKYVEDKDVFQKFYSNMLARRLVNNMSISEDSEAQMISLLKGACGIEYTSKLQRMFQDVSSSRELNARFNEWASERPDSPTLLRGVDFSIMVLSSNAWPFQGQGGFSVPPELENCFKVFTEFYQTHHEGRKLTWCYQLCRGDVVTHYTKMRYTFQVSTHQMAILMLYNTSLVYTVSQIQSQTGIDMNTLTQLLNIFLKGRVLKVAVDETKKSSEGEGQRHTDGAGASQTDALSSTQTPQLAPDTLLRLYTDYNNKRIRVNLNLPVKSEAKQEAETTLNTVECDRKLSIQACIVRIMKMRKRMEHQQLIKEVIEQMSSRFCPAIQQIKLCINSLIEREFIKRDSTNLSAYEYVA